MPRGPDQESACEESGVTNFSECQWFCVKFAEAKARKRSDKLLVWSTNRGSMWPETKLKFSFVELRLKIAADWFSVSDIWCSLLWILLIPACCSCAVSQHSSSLSSGWIKLKWAASHWESALWKRWRLFFWFGGRFLRFWEVHKVVRT